MDYGKRIKHLRKLNNFTTTQLAQKLNLSQSVVSRLENNNRSIDIPIIEKLCSVFNITIQDFFSSAQLDLDPSFNFQILYKALSEDQKQFLYKYIYYISISKDYELDDLDAINNTLEKIMNPNISLETRLKLNKLIDFYLNELDI